MAIVFDNLEELVQWGHIGAVAVTVELKLHVQVHVQTNILQPLGRVFRDQVSISS